MAGTPKILTSIHGSQCGIAATGEFIVGRGSGTASAISGPTRAPLWVPAPAPALMDPLQYFQIFDDFTNPASATASDVMTWTAVTDGATGTPAFASGSGGVGGVFNTVTAAADNDYSAYTSVSSPFLFASGKELWFEARFKIAEATTQESTWWFGLTDTVTTGGFRSDTSGPLASYVGALIYKTPETAMTVNFQTSNAASQATLSAFATSITNTWHRCGFYFDGTATTSKIYPYFHNGTSWTAGTYKNITLSGATAMKIVWGVKAGPTAAAETLAVDYIKCVQLR